MTTMNMTEVEHRISGLPEEQQKAVVCALVGHSRIQTICFGYFYCGRCGSQVGDSWGATYRAEGVVIVGHNCDKCRANYENVTWRDTFLAVDPFKRDKDFEEIAQS